MMIDDVNSGAKIDRIFLDRVLRLDLPATARHISAR